MLSGGLEHLIDLMTSADQGDSDEDEGLGWAGDGGPGEAGPELLQQVLQLCRHHLASPAEAATHYRAVLRALVAESDEMSQFMSGLGEKQLAELDRGDWGVMWTHVMTQLRQGVKLQKVEYSKTPVEFALTPYEMLMDDIRGRKYSLVPVTLSLQVQRGAREIILDFIRARPPLRPVEQRRLARRESDPSPQESLMAEIRGDRARASLKKAKTVEKSLLNREELKIGKIVQPTTGVNGKKVIDLDQSFADNILNFDDDQAETDSPDNSALEADYSQSEVRPNTVVTLPDPYPESDQATKSAPLTVLKSSQSVPEPNMKPEWRCGEREGKENRDPGGAGGGSKYSDWTKTLHTLDLSLAEVAHIRAVMTKVELEERELPTGQIRELERGRLCFQCARVKFGLFTWAVTCQLCTRSVCSSCTARIALPSTKLAEIPVQSLAGQLNSEDQQQLPVPSLARDGRQSFRSRERCPGPGRAQRVARARSADRGLVASLAARRLAGARAGITDGVLHSVCKDCRDVLASIVRAQRMAAKLDRMRGGFRQGWPVCRE